MNLYAAWAVEHLVSALQWIHVGAFLAVPIYLGAAEAMADRALEGVTWH